MLKLTNLLRIKKTTRQIAIRINATVAEKRPMCASCVDIGTIYQRVQNLLAFSQYSHRQKMPGHPSAAAVPK